MDVPSPNDQQVLEFAAITELAGTSDDNNAGTWATSSERNQHDTLEGNWSSRWNGGADPTMPGDANNKWKQGQAELRTAEDRVYVLFDWNHGARKGLIDCTARRHNEVGWQVYQFDRSKDHTSLGRLGRQQSEDRWTVVRRTSGFPPMRRRDPDD
jgi:hypothetical protein